jgi:hypothetical protein
MKQTAVEWLVDKVLQTNHLKAIFEDEINQAKEREKQQIIDAWEDGQNSFPTINAKQYYKETFKNK